MKMIHIWYRDAGLPVVREPRCFIKSVDDGPAEADRIDPDGDPLLNLSHPAGAFRLLPRGGEKFYLHLAIGDAQ